MLGFGNLLMGGRVPFGPELVTNGSFAADVAWSKGAGWSIIGGTPGLASRINTGSVTALGQAVALIAGRTYRLEVSVVSISSTISPRFTGGTQVIGPSISATGLFVTNLVAASGNTSLGFFGATNFEGSINGVSLREVL